MLKRKKSPMIRSSNANHQTSNKHAPSITYITESTQITANLYCEDDVRIAGSISGEIESKKKVMLSETGTINGSIHSPNADISGKVTGDVRADEKLILRSTAKVDGQIFTKKLTIENGARVKGAFKVGPDVQINPTHKSEPQKKASKES
jgi:cytoskeletal protein CcmA (bactofilin family)|tara:strand:- start:3729 stop:4175 length:447 start_codon:yes stop_codon:yes gene_type:complete